MDLEEHYNARELAAFWAVMPPGALLHYSYSTKAYEVRVKDEARQSTRCLRSIPRSTIVKWRDPRLTLNYAARHALKEAGLPAEFRVG